MPVERLGAEVREQRRGPGRIAAEAEQVLEPQLLAFFARQQLGRGDAHDLVAQRPQRVEAERLVPGGVGDDVGVLALRVLTS